MKPDDIRAMFVGITEPTKEILAKKLSGILTKVILEVNEDLKNTNPADPLSLMTPPPGLVFEAFRVCPMEKTRVVIIGQDPYIKPGEAMGMSFSVPTGVSVPPSLRNIYKCLLNCGLIKAMPTHGNLTLWARQGVLLINSALTTRLRQSDAHGGIWKPYTDAVIRELSAMTASPTSQSLIFILLGLPAQEKAKLIDKKHIILQWGHPSNMNPANTKPGPKNFINCDCFTRVNEHLSLRRQSPINWNVSIDAADEINPDNANIGNLRVEDPLDVRVEAPAHIIPQAHVAAPQEKLPDPVLAVADYIGAPVVKCDPICVDGLDEQTIWVFTDGGASANGKAKCTSSYAWYITDTTIAMSCCGDVPPVDIPGCEYKSSNQRAELTAILSALNYLVGAAGCFRAGGKIKVVSDSDYSINCITVWVNAWLKKGTTKKNLDLVFPAKTALDRLSAAYTVEFLHCNSHLVEPPAKDLSWFIWKGNDIVDLMCAGVLKKK